MADQIYAVRAALPHMLGREGDIVAVASVAGLRGLPLESVCASKFGQVGFIRSLLDHELRERGIRATNVCLAAQRPTFALDEGRQPLPSDVLAGMMTGEDVPEVVVFVLELPRRFRMLDLVFRPQGEASWGYSPNRRCHRQPTSTTTCSKTRHDGAPYEFTAVGSRDRARAGAYARVRNRARARLVRGAARGRMEPRRGVHSRSRT